MPAVATKYTYEVKLTHWTPIPNTEDQWTSTEFVYGCTDKIAAILLTRAIVRTGLKEAKDLVEGLYHTRYNNYDVVCTKLE
jgi:ribosomal protein L7/L12